MDLDDTILITGGGGLVGMSLQQTMRAKGFRRIIALRSADCDLTDLPATLRVFSTAQPKYVFHLAGYVHGIMGNMRNKGMSYLKNTLINTHVVEACRTIHATKVVAMGSGCVYPYPSPGLPLQEDMIWFGEPHDSERAYAHAKRGLLAQLTAYYEDYGMDFAFVVSANLFGPHDKFDTKYGHVIPSLIRKFYEAKGGGGTVEVWGDGSARRDFLYVSDVSEALCKIMDGVHGAVNMGSGEVSSIRDVVEHLARHTEMSHRLRWDASKPNGQDYRAYDLTKLQATGFAPRYSLKDGLQATYDWYAGNADSARQ